MIIESIMNAEVYVLKKTSNDEKNSLCVFILH